MISSNTPYPNSAHQVSLGNTGTFLGASIIEFGLVTPSPQDCVTSDWNGSSNSTRAKASTFYCLRFDMTEGSGFMTVKMNTSANAFDPSVSNFASTIRPISASTGSYLHLIDALLLLCFIPIIRVFRTSGT